MSDLPYWIGEKGAGHESDVYLADSITRMNKRVEGAVAVCGSHGGNVSVQYALCFGLKGVILNDAGVGKDSAGISGTELGQRYHLAVATVAHDSSRIGDGQDTFENGVISHANLMAQNLGIQVGMPCSKAAQNMARYATLNDVPPRNIAKSPVWMITNFEIPVVVADSASQLSPKYAHSIFITGSHGGSVGGTAVKEPVHFAIFNDAGVGKENAGLGRLSIMDSMGIPGATLDYRSARIGDGLDAIANGKTSYVNVCAGKKYAIEVGLSVQEVITRLCSIKSNRTL